MAPARKFSLEEVARHNKAGDCWVMFEDKVLDLSQWMEKHPGGKGSILAVAGTDATDEIMAMHPIKVIDKMMPRYIIGEVEGLKVPPHVRSFRELIHSVTRDPEWMETDSFFYYKRIPMYVGLLVSALVLYLGTNSIFLHFLGGICLGLFWQQTLLVGHDAGHGGITHDMKKDYWIGWVVGTLCNGFSINWWRKNHNTHHVATNSVEHDPDIQHLPFLAISEKFFENIYSTYYERVFEYDEVARQLVMIQHLLFYPVMVFARFFVHVQGFIMLLDFTKPVPNRHIELLGMGLYFSWYLSLVCIPQHGFWSRLAFIGAAHLTAGIIHVQITLNHFASPVHSDKGALGARGGDDFLKAQLTGTCDIACPESMDWFHGGLQFQVEHHLCPRMPRHNLRRFVPEIQKLAKKYGLPHSTYTFPEADALVRKQLEDVAMAAKHKRTAKGKAL